MDAIAVLHRNITTSWITLQTKLRLEWILMSRVDLDAGLCVICQKVLKTVRKGGSRLIWNPCSYLRSGEAVVKAAEAGCHLCRTILAAARHRLAATESRTSIVDLQSLKLMVGFYNDTVQGSEFLFSLNCEELRRYCRLEVLSNTGFAHKYPEVTHAPSVSSRTDSNGCMRLAATWLESCLKEHKDCCRPEPLQKWYPTRLVEICSSQQEPQLRLVVSDQSQMAGPYMTLSHCWGKAQVLTLTSVKLEAFKTGIQWEILPKTFHEALVVIHSLGIRYLWIDSLCIIQDSDADWRKECALMDQVYRNSHCNLAANFSIDCHGGLFVERDPLDVGALEIKLEKRGRTEAFHCVDLNQFSDCVNSSPLNRRGWVLQERLLAPRILHFGSEQLFWECCNLQASEAFPFGKPTIGQRSEYASINVFKGPATEASRLQSLDRNARYLYLTGLQEDWRRIVRVYTRAALTEERDKLVAISALAREMRVVTNDDYLAGLWRTSLVDDLLWYAVHGKRPKSYRAPSWSWASIDGPVDYYSDSMRSVNGRLVCNLVEVVDVQTTPVADNPFGELKGGYLRLSGMLRAAKWAGKKDDALDLLIDGEIVNSYPRKGVHRSLGQAIEPDDIADFLSTDIYCLPVALNWKYARLDGLVLISTNKSARQFKRVGYFSVEHVKGIKRILDAPGLPLKFPQREFVAMRRRRNDEIDPLCADYFAMLRNRDTITIV